MSQHRKHRGYKVYHCTGCVRSSGPLVTRPGYFDEVACCTCCHDSAGNRGPGRNRGGY